jgi:hypothetical protein
MRLQRTPVVSCRYTGMARVIPPQSFPSALSYLLIAALIHMEMLKL